ncbi:MAG: NAD(P)H-hydrate epimerase [Phycisphaerae bacterium]|nr:NAD(P)H-hydrate epimerase [Phycisphaerae bacterium]
MQHTPQPTLIFTRERARALDKAAAEDLGIPSILLMEHAAFALADAALRLIREKNLTRIGIVCGPGNNGGDGLALARHLALHNIDPLIALASVPGQYKGDAATNLHIVEQMGLRILDPIVSMAPQAALEILHRDGRDHAYDRDPKDVLLIDALLGTGLDRPVKPPMDQAIRWMNALRARGATTLAADIPSGLDADTGLPIGEHVVRADITVTFAGMKQGFLEPQSRDYTGNVIVAGIGLPHEFMKKFALDWRYT